MSREYFSELYKASSAFIAQLGLSATAMTLTEIRNVLQPRAERCRGAVIASLQELRKYAPDKTRNTDNAGGGAVVGLNTVGFLCDRLTVLAMKEWVLENRLGSSDRARVLRETQVRELLDALDGARPGYSSFAQKISQLSAEAIAETWEEAYAGLLCINVLLWEAQEVLYAGQLKELECDELRRYIAMFSEGNIRRNNYIAKSETLFWVEIGGGDRPPVSG